MTRTRALAFLSAALALHGCTEVALGDLARDGAVRAAETSVTAGDSAVAPVDAVIEPANDAPITVADDVVVTPSPDVVAPPPFDVVTPSPDVVAPPPLDVVIPPLDVVIPRPDVVTPRPDVVPPRPDVVVSPDLPVVCEACMPFAPVAFCNGMGSGACLAYAGCRDSCATCVQPMMVGDTCANAPVITAAQRNRTVLTTCGARNNLETGCRLFGPDVAFILRVPRMGRVRLVVTVPEGVGVVFGYDPPGMCRAENGARRCNDFVPRRTQDFDGELAPGDWPIYVATTTSSTVVVDTELR